MSDNPHRVQLRQRQDFQFEIDFHAGKPPLLGDLDPPMGQGLGPTPEQLLAAAVGTCMSDSLLFALRKFKQAPEPMACLVTPEVGRNAQNRMRVLSLDVAFTLGVPAEKLEHLDRVLGQFEDFCTVGASVAQGIPVRLTVHDAAGRRLK